MESEGIMNAKLIVSFIIVFIHELFAQQSQLDYNIYLAPGSISDLNEGDVQIVKYNLTCGGNLTWCMCMTRMTAHLDDPRIAKIHENASLELDWVKLPKYVMTDGSFAVKGTRLGRTFLYLNIHPRSDDLEGPESVQILGDHDYEVCMRL